MSFIPKISILLPTYNGAHSIGKAIDSVLAQSFKEWELVIIDDGSSDTVAEVIKGYQKNHANIVYSKNEQNRGLAQSLNKGMVIAQGKYIARIDDDDEWIDSEKLQYQIEQLENNPDTLLIGTGVVLVNEYNKEVTRYYMPETDQQIRDKLLRMNCFIHSSVVFNKEIAKNVKGYEGVLEDYQLWLKMGAHGKMANLKRYSVKYQIRAQSVNSSNKKIRTRENIVLIKKYKEFYPNYWKAITMAYIQLYFFSVFNALPRPIKGIVMKIHKKI